MTSDRSDRLDPETLAKHGAAVRGLAVAILGDTHAADDVAQETFLAALRGVGASVRDPGAWLKGVSRNLSRRWIRTESRRRHREDVRPPPAAQASPEEIAERLETEAGLTEAVRALPEPYRTVVVLRYFDGLTTAETAARTGVPEATVKTRLRRALAMLRDALDDRYGARAVWLPLLIRVTRPRAPAVAAAAIGTTALVAGGAIMAKKILAVIVVAAVLAAVFVAPGLRDRSAPEPAPDDTFQEPSGIAGGPGAVPGSEAPDDPGPGGAIPADRPEEQFRVVVRYADGSPAAGARVLVFGRAGGTAEGGTTGEDGVAALPASGEAAKIHVQAPGAAPETRDVHALAGTEVEVNLDLGSVISGILWFGDEPAAGVEVHLNSLDDSVPQLVTVTDGAGGFTFSGLPVGSRFSFFAGWEIYFVDPPGGVNVKLSAPATELALRAERYPRVIGTVVRSDGVPVAGATVDLECKTNDGGGCSSMVKAGEDGGFDVTASGARGELGWLSLTVSAPDGASREVLEPDPARLSGGLLDLGRVVLRDARTFEFIVRGPEGEPVPGAVVVPSDDSSRGSAPTDESGKTALEVAAMTNSVRAGAPGLGVEEIALPDESNGPIEVSLPGGTLLNLRVRTPAGTVPAHLGLLLEAAARLLDGTEVGGDPVYSRAGASRAGAAYSSEERTRLNYPVPEDGSVRIAGIRPGVGFQLTVLDRFTGQRLDTRELTLGEREHRNLDIELDIVDRTLVVRVLVPGDQPLPGAWVMARGGERHLSARTGVDGVARLEGIRGEEVQVEVRRGGFVPFVGTFDVASLDGEIPVVLGPGRVVRLTVTDPAGDPVFCEGADARAVDLDYLFQGYEEAEGLYRFSDLPAQEVRIFVNCAGAIREVAVPSGDSKAHLTVPATGSVVVRFDGKLDVPTSHRIRLIPTSGSKGVEVFGDVGFAPDKEHWEIRIPAALPGAYRVTLEHWVDSEENDTDIHEKCRTGSVIEVAAGRETQTVLVR